MLPQGVQFQTDSSKSLYNDCVGIYNEFDKTVKA